MECVVGEEGTPRAGEMVEREIPEVLKDGIGLDRPSSLDWEYSLEELMVLMGVVSFFVWLWLWLSLWLSLWGV